MTNHRMRMTAIYARKSTESEDRQVLSIDSQVSELKATADRHGFRIDRVFTESMSAKAPGRPVFNELYKMVQKGKVDRIICWKLDRLARNPLDGGALIWALDQGQIQTIVTPASTYSNSGSDKFLMQLEFGMAKKYVDDLSDNVKRGIRARLNKGWASGRPPLGYLNDRNERTIIKDPERFPLIRRMWDMMLSGKMTPPRILTLANSSWGLRTRQFKREGGAPLGLSSIYRIFRNPFYYGMIKHGGELMPGSHEPMVAKAEFDRIQVLLGVEDNPRPKKHRFAFTGLIRCGECGGSITAEHKVNRQGHEYVYYHCTRRKKNTKCSQRVIEVQKLESQVSSFLRSISIHPDFLTWVTALARELQDDEAKKVKTSQNALKRRLDTCKRELSELVNLRLRGLLNDDEYLNKKNELETERAKIREILANADGAFDEVSACSLEAFWFAATAGQVFDSGDNVVKRACLKYIGSNPTLLDGILCINALEPFLLIKKTLSTCNGNNDRFEPSVFRFTKLNDPSHEPMFGTGQALVHDVRTFYWKRLKEGWCHRLPDVLKNIKPTKRRKGGKVVV